MGQDRPGQRAPCIALRSPASESRCSRRRSPGGKHIGCLCHAGGHWCRYQKTSARFAWGCSALYACAMSCTTVLLRKVPPGNNGSVEHCDGRKRGKLVRALSRLVPILRRLSVICCYHDQYAKATRSDKPMVSLENRASMTACSTTLDYVPVPKMRYIREK